jgi:hypothetical protein
MITNGRLPIPLFDGISHVDILDAKTVDHNDQEAATTRGGERELLLAGGE